MFCEAKAMRNLTIFCATAVLAGAALPALAAPECSIHPPKGASDAQLQSMAKISKSEAEQHARARLKSSGNVSTSSAELEAENGCLIWSFDMKVEGRSGVQEVTVDAGNGKVLNVHHESAREESAEAKSESKSKSQSGQPDPARNR
jgi:hypothetical protein